MNVVEVLNVKLQRNDQTVSWGFNVQGGKEFHCPLVIQKVNPNSLADRCSIQPGDFILKVGSMSTEHLTHNQARDAIIRQGNNLELTLQRGAPPRPDDYQARLDFPQHQLMNPESIQQKQTLSPQVGVQLGKNKALLTQSYNSPMGLYSSQNIADTLVTSMKNMEKNEMSSSSSTSSTSSVSSQSLSPPSIDKPASNEVPNNNMCRITVGNLNAKPKPFRKVSIACDANMPYKQKLKTILINQEQNADEKSNEENLFRAVPLKIDNEELDKENSFVCHATESTCSSSSASAGLKPNDSLKKKFNKTIHELSSKFNQNSAHCSLRSESKDWQICSDINNNIFNKNLENHKLMHNKRNHSVGNIQRDFYLKPSSSIQLNSQLGSSQRRLSEENLLENEQHKPSLGTASFNSQHSQRRSSSRNVARLGDPSKPSVTQSPTIKLLQEMLDNGLETNEVLVHNNKINQNYVRRCSIQPNPNAFKTAINKQITLTNISNTMKTNLTLVNKPSVKAKSDIEEALIQERKRYIRSLSLANDELVEPSFLAHSKLFKEKMKKHSIDATLQETNTTSTSLID